MRVATGKSDERDCEKCDREHREERAHADGRGKIAASKGTELTLHLTSVAPGAIKTSVNSHSAYRATVPTRERR